MASIDKRGGYYKVRWRDPDGKARSRKCPDLQTAKRLQRTVEQCAAEGLRWEPREPRQVPDLREVMEAYIGHCSMIHEGTTSVLYARHVECFLGWLQDREGAAARLEPGLLSRATVTEWYMALQHGGRHGHGRSLETRKKMVHAVERAWAYGHDHEEYGEFVPEPRRMANLPTDPGKPTIAPTWAEMDDCIRVAVGPVRQLAVVLRFTGLRVQQAMGLRWSDFDLDQAVLYFPGHLGKTKQEKRGRTIPVSSHLVEELRSWEHKHEFVIDSNRKPGTYHRVARQRDMLRAWERAGVRKMVWEGDSHHCFRNGFVSGLKRAGADDEAVEYLVGHSLGLRTLYTDPDALPLRSAVRRIPPVAKEASNPVVNLEERRKRRRT